MPRKYAQNKTLGVWVMNQRHQYKLKFNDKSCLMTAERQAALEKIGFKWGVLNHISWQTRFDELIAFKQQHAHCNVSYIDEH